MSTGAASTDRMFDLIQAITEDPIPALSPQAFSPELCGFVDLMLRRDPAERPTAPELLKHPFLVENHDQGCHVQSLVDMVKVAPATLPEVGCWADVRFAGRPFYDTAITERYISVLSCVLQLSFSPSATAATTDAKIARLRQTRTRKKLNTSTLERCAMRRLKNDRFKAS